MEDDKIHYVVITPQRLAFGFGQPPEGGPKRVMVLMDYDSSEAPWLAPNTRLSLSMTPEEARSVAQSLERMADKAED